MSVGFNLSFFALVHHFDALYLFFNWKCGSLSRSHLIWMLILIRGVENVGWIILLFRSWQFEVVLSEFSCVLLLFGLDWIILSRSVEIKFRHRLISADALLRNVVFLIEIQIWVIRALNVLKQSRVLYRFPQVAHLPYSRWFLRSFVRDNLDSINPFLLLGAKITFWRRRWKLILSNKHDLFFILPLSWMRPWVLLLKPHLVILPNTLSILLLLSRHFSPLEAINY
jgi:hypothetical protein